MALEYRSCGVVGGVSSSDCLLFSISAVKQSRRLFAACDSVKYEAQGSPNQQAFPVTAFS